MFKMQDPQKIMAYVSVLALGLMLGVLVKAGFTRIETPSSHEEQINQLTATHQKIIDELTLEYDAKIVEQSQTIDLWRNRALSAERENNAITAKAANGNPNAITQFDVLIAPAPQEEPASQEK